MRLGRRKFAYTLATAMVCSLLSLDASGEMYSLSGRVSDTEAHAVPGATVSARRVRDGKMFTARSNGDGVYTIAGLKSGDYKVWAKAGQLSARPVKVTLAAGQTTDLVLSPNIRSVKK
jgi:hypothetical protein